MANVKITQLPSATTPLTGTEVFPLVQGTTTKQVAITGLFTSPVMSNPTLGVVGQADLINATGLPIASGVSGLGAGIATFLGTPSSANLRTAVTDETGTGALVFANAPVLVAPDLGTPTFLVATNATGTAVGLTAGSAITNANLTGAVTSVGNATSLGSFTSAQLRTALTDETGAGSAVFATSPTITAPILNQINDTNNAQILGLSPTTSAVDYLVVKNGTGVGVPLHFYADGSSANIGLHIQPKGTGLVTISDGTDFNKGIRFRSSSSAASAVTLLDAVSTAGRVVTLPDATTTLVGRDTTDTLTNKTIAFSSNTFSGTLAIANGGTGQSTANAALNALLPSQTGNATKYLQTDGSNSSWDAISLSTADITGTLGTANGGTGLTSFTSGGVVYASSTSALATGSALTFDGTTLTATTTTGIPLVVTGTGSVGARIVGGTGSGFGSYLSLQAQGGNAAAIGTEASIVGSGTSTNLMLYGYGSNSIIFAPATAEAMRLTSTSLYTASGIKVGIGHSNPLYPLDVQGTIGEVFVKSTTGTNYAALNVNNTGGNFYAGINNSAGTAFSTTAYSAILWHTGNYPMVFATNNGEKMRLDSAGNLGLGVTPSAWDSIIKVLELNNGVSYGAQTDSEPVLYLGVNNYYGAGADRYKVSSKAATRYRSNAGEHSWFTAPSGTAGNAISFTQAMTLDASGRLIIGATTSGSATGVMQTISSSSAAYTQYNRGTNGGGIVGTEGTGLVFYTYTGALGSETYTLRASIDSSGNFGVATGGTNGSKLQVGVGTPRETTASFFGTGNSIASSIATVGIYSTDTSGAGVGPSLALGGQTGNAANPYPFGLIQGAKNSATAGDYGGYLQFYTIPANGGSPIPNLILTTGGGVQAYSTIAVGSVPPSASGAGITFPATQNASSDANTLDDYEEGDWTPNQGSGLTVVGTFSSSGKYTKVGRMVTIRGVVLGSTSVAATAAGTICSNSPFSAESDTAGSYFNGTLSAGGQVDAAGGSVFAVGTIAASVGIYFSATYAI